MAKRVWVTAVFGVAMLAGTGAFAQRVAKAEQIAVTAAPPVSTEDPGATQEKLMELLHVSPGLANVLASDPSLLADQQYVERTNPELAAFLAQHPEVVRTPGFYLFSNLRGPGQKRYSVLEPKQGFEREREPNQHEVMDAVFRNVMPLIALVLIGGAVLWLVRVFVENKRWSKVFRMQSEAHARLIEKFGANEELLRYMETDAGKRFLEAAPVSVESAGRTLPNLVGRVLASLQGGLVLALLGVGFLATRKSVGEGEVAMLVLGMLTLMPGLGLILSAGLTWGLGRRLELIAPVSADAPERQ